MSTLSSEGAWRWLPDNGTATSRLVREVDWAATAVGPVDGWSTGLRGAVAMLLHASYPMFLWWGPELVQFYNDGYVPSFGRGRHPAAMGQRGRDCWSEIWDVIGPQIESVRATGRPVQFEDALVPITRNGRLEDVFWTYTYTPVFEADGSIGGVLVIVHETTASVVTARRRRLVGEVVGALPTARSAHALFDAVARALPGSDFAWLIGHAQGTPGAAGGDGGRYASASAPDRDAVRAVPPDRVLTVPIVQDSGERRGELLLGVAATRPCDDALRDHAALLGLLLGNALARLDASAARVSAEHARTNLLMHAPVGAALMVGPDLRFELANRRYVELIGREVVGQTWRGAFPELVGGPVEALVFGAYERGEVYRAQEQLVPLATPGGGSEDHYFDFNLIPVRTDDHVDCVLVVAVDLTQQVRARRALEQAGVERDKLLADLETASAAKDHFLAMLGHELRNPLAPIVTALELLDTRDRASVDRAKEVIGRQVKHVVRLVDDLLDIARLTRGLVELRTDTVAVATIVTNALEIANELITTRRHRLAIDVGDGLTWHGDPTRMTQVLANLLTNAARYTEPGGDIAVTAAADPAAADRLVLTVRDNGKGIEEPLLARIFESFVQGPRTVDRRDGGLGLGLALAQNLVTMHGGTIRAHSAGVGRGSEFVVTLPGLVTASAAAAAPRARRPTDRVRRRILVVDDNVDAAELLGDVLQLHGHDVAIAHDGPQAVSAFERFHPDTAILDIGLPGMDGYELLSALRERGAGAACQYYALTGFAQSDDIARARDAGFVGHLSKPVNLDRLRELLGRERATDS
nr:ATP-binding protein [Kofleriaceae bacterium]